MHQRPSMVATHLPTLRPLQDIAELVVANQFEDSINLLFSAALEM